MDHSVFVCVIAVDTCCVYIDTQNVLTYVRTYVHMYITTWCDLLLLATATLVDMYTLQGLTLHHAHVQTMGIQAWQFVVCTVACASQQ